MIELISGLFEQGRRAYNFVKSGIIFPIILSAGVLTATAQPVRADDTEDVVKTAVQEAWQSIGYVRASATRSPADTTIDGMAGGRFTAGDWKPGVFARVQSQSFDKGSDVLREKLTLDLGRAYKSGEYTFWIDPYAGWQGENYKGFAKGETNRGLAGMQAGVASGPVQALLNLSTGIGRYDLTLADTVDMNGSVGNWDAGLELRTKIFGQGDVPRQGKARLLGEDDKNSLYTIIQVTGSNERLSGLTNTKTTRVAVSLPYVINDRNGSTKTMWTIAPMFDYTQSTTNSDLLKDVSNQRLRAGIGLTIRPVHWLVGINLGAGHQWTETDARGVPTSRKQDGAYVTGGLEAIF